MGNDILARLRAPLQEAKYILRLYVAGSTPQSSRAITNLKAICETYLKNRYDLTVVDLYEQQERAQESDMATQLQAEHAKLTDFTEQLNQLDKKMQ